MNVYGPKNVVYVSIPGYTAKYGFRTNIEPVAASAFGHKPVLTHPEPVVFGAKKPRPPRGQYIGGLPSRSFVDLADYDQQTVRLIDGGSGPIGANNRSGRRTKRVWVRWWGAEYVFDQKTAPLIGDLDADVLWGDYTRPRVNSFYLANDLILDGSNKGKPLRAKTIGETEGTFAHGRQMSSFIHTPVTAALPSRWTIIGGNAL